MVQTFPATHTGQDRPYTLLSIGGHALLLPQSEIRTLAPVQDIRMVPQHASGMLGWLPFAGRHWPVYGLDEALNVRPDILPEQRICALVRLNDGYFGLVCAHVTLVPSATVRIRPVPAAMTMPNSPLQGLTWHADGIVLLSTAAALAALLGVSEAAAPTALAPSPSGTGAGEYASPSTGRSTRE